MRHAIGSTVYNRGFAVTITSEPYQVHGGEFQDGTEDETGRKVSVPTPRHVEAKAAREQAEWKEQQEQFRRVAKAREDRRIEREGDRLAAMTRRQVEAEFGAISDQEWREVFGTNEGASS